MMTHAEQSLLIREYLLATRGFERVWATMDGPVLKADPGKANWKYVGEAKSLVLKAMDHSSERAA